MRREQATAHGTIHRLTLDSTVLKGNLLGDPTARLIDVYVPAGHDGKNLPLLVDLLLHDTSKHIAMLRFIQDQG